MSDLRPLHPTLAAELLGIRPDLQVNDATFAAIEAARLRYPVLVFRNIAAMPAQQIAFSRRLGPLHFMLPLRYNLAGHPELFVVFNVEEAGTQVGMRRVGLGWHTDGEDKCIPNAASFLNALQLPAEGGDSMFTDIYAAYNALPAGIRARIQGRRARFSRVELHRVHSPLELDYTPNKSPNGPTCGTR